MECYFCHKKPTSSCNVSEIGEYLIAWFCSFCPHAVRLSYSKKLKKLIAAHIFYDKNGNGYKWSFDLLNNKSSLQANGKCIVQINFLSNVTPQNFENKLKLYLTFS